MIIPDQLVTYRINYDALHRPRIQYVQMSRAIVHQRILVFVRHDFVMRRTRSLTIFIITPEMSISWIVDRLVVVIADESRP